MNAEEQKKYMELQIIDQQARQIQQTLANLDQQTAEVALTLEHINELEEVKADSEALVPFVNGIFVKAKINDVKEMFVNIGSGTITAKTPKEVKELLTRQMNEINGYKE